MATMRSKSCNERHVSHCFGYSKKTRLILAMTYTNGFDESETQNGVREELATESWVAGDGGQERGENETDTDTGTTETDGSVTHTNVLGDLDKGVGHLRGVGAGGLGTEAGRVDDVGGALHGVEGGGLAGGSWKTTDDMLALNNSPMTALRFD
jgi:hypothetical protein